MQFQVPVDIKNLPVPMGYQDKLLLMGSCFTEHIGNALSELKFDVLQNPNGILFGPDSVCKSLQSYVQQKSYSADALFQLNEVWNSWDHHSRFSSVNKQEAISIINNSIHAAHDFLKEADWLVLTLGSSFSYRLTEQAALAGSAPGMGVANCHRAPSAWFSKEMLPASSIISMLTDTMKSLLQFNPKLRFLFTVSPVRHIRDGVVENNRSKARLIEAVHSVVDKFDQAHYFPAYEIVIDVLRDYRFYDVDLVHPNYAATQYVLERFTEACMTKETRELMEQVKGLVIARKHRPFQPSTTAHRQFLATHFEKATNLQRQYPFLNLSKEISYFSQT